MPLNSWPCCVQGFDAGFSEEISFVTGPQVGPDAEIKVVANADMGHVEPDGSYEFEYDRNQRLVSCASPAHHQSQLSHLQASNSAC